MMGPWVIERRADARRHRAPVRRHAGLPGAGPRLGAGRAPPASRILGISPTAIRALMRAGDDWVDAPRPVQPAHPRLAPASPGTLTRGAGTSRRGRRRALPDHQLLAAAPRSPAASSVLRLTPLKPCRFNGAGPGHGRRRGRRRRASRCAARSASWSIRQPWPGMTRGFWRDPERYLETYWSRLPGLWVHGDWALIDADGYWYILGRSDDTIKVAGKRLGPAEVESAAVAHPARRRGRRHRRARRAQGRGSWCSASRAGGRRQRGATAEIARRDRALAWQAAQPERVLAGAASCRKRARPRSCGG